MINTINKFRRFGLAIKKVWTIFKYLIILELVKIVDFLDSSDESILLATTNLLLKLIPAIKGIVINPVFTFEN